MPRTLSQRQKLLYAAAAICKPCCGSGQGSGSGSGSGSGGGASGYCCKCARFACADVDNFPDALDFTLVVPCIGTKAVTMNKITNYIGVDLVSGCRPQRIGQRSNGPGDRWENANVIYEYSVNTLFDSEEYTASYTDCNNGLPVGLLTFIEGEYLVAEIMCLKCGLSQCDDPGIPPEEDGSIWVFSFQWWKLDNVGGTVRLVQGHLPLTVSSCSPLSLTGEAIITCRAYLSDPLWANCVNGLDDEVDSGMSECVGGTIQVDADES